MRNRPEIEKRGTVDCDLVETTPIVFAGSLIRFESIRIRYRSNRTGSPFFRLLDVDSAEVLTEFAPGFDLGCAYVEGDTVYVYGVRGWGGQEIGAFWTSDLERWDSWKALDLAGWAVYNTSVCRAGDRYIMAIELGEPKELVGKRFTIFFAESPDLKDWSMLPLDRVFSRDRYTACPAIRYIDGRFYMVYLEAKPGPSYEPHIVRSGDLSVWEESPLNPFLSPSEGDKRIANLNLPQDLQERIRDAVNINNSDVDFCEYRGDTVINYSWGNQKGIEFLAEARFEGTPEELLTGFFRE